MKHKKPYLSKSGLPMLALALALSGSILLPDAIPHDPEISHLPFAEEYSSPKNDEAEYDGSILPMSDLDSKLKLEG